MGNRDKLLIIFRGSTNGGKTFVCNLLERVFGGYSARIPITSLTGKRERGSGATPDLAVLEGKRIAITQEPSGNEILNLGIIKELTGNEGSIYVRQLYKKGKSAKISAKIIMSMNPVSIATNIDKASAGRIRVIPFDSTFVDDEKMIDEKNNIYLGNRHADELIPDMISPFLSLVKSEYENYKRYGLETPREIYQATDSFIEQNEPLVQYINSKTEKSDIGLIHSSILWERYKDWFSVNYPGTKVCNTKYFRETLRHQGLNMKGEDMNGYIYGVTFKNDSSD